MLGGRETDHSQKESGQRDGGTGRGEGQRLKKRNCCVLHTGANSIQGVGTLALQTHKIKGGAPRDQEGRGGTGDSDVLCTTTNLYYRHEFIN